MTDQPATVLFVCTGNICRSAYGHHRLAGLLGERVPGRFRVISAGAQMNPALTVPSQILGLPGAAGLEGLAEHTPAQLRARTIQEADLILAATEDHVSTILREAPGALHRVFTMLEFGAAVSALQAGTIPDWTEPASGTGPLGERLRGLARHIARHRPSARGALASIDLPDPFRREDAAYTAMAEALDPALDRTADLLTGMAQQR